MIMGTADYMAPEQAVPGKPLDHRADVYALGATLFHLVTGRPPFAGQKGADLLLAHQSLPVPRVDAIRPGLPAELSTIIQKMMAKKPENRYQSANEVIEALQPFEAEEAVAEPAAEPAAAAPRGAYDLWKQKWLVPGVLGGAALFGLIAAVAVNWIKATGK
jgi:serine/threonine-protein kinase